MAIGCSARSPETWFQSTKPPPLLEPLLEPLIEPLKLPNLPPKLPSPLLGVAEDAL
jgi:hypothetical protein